MLAPHPQEYELAYYVNKKEYDKGGPPADVLDLRGAKITVWHARQRGQPP